MEEYGQLDGHSPWNISAWEETGRLPNVIHAARVTEIHKFSYLTYYSTYFICEYLNEIGEKR